MFKLYIDSNDALNLLNDEKTMQWYLVDGGYENNIEQQKMSVITLRHGRYGNNWLKKMFVQDFIEDRHGRQKESVK